MNKKSALVLALIAALGAATYGIIRGLKTVALLSPFCVAAWMLFFSERQFSTGSIFGAFFISCGMALVITRGDLR